MEELVKKIGLDKLTHLGWGGWISSLITVMLIILTGSAQDWLTLLWASLGVTVATLLSILKEKLDPEFNWADVAWSAGGAVTVFLTVLVCLSFKLI